MGDYDSKYSGEEIDAAVESANQEPTDRETAINSLRTELDKAKASVSDLNNEVAQRESLAKTVADLQSKVSALEKGGFASASDLTNLTSRVKNVEDTLSSISSTVASLKSSVETLEKELESTGILTIIEIADTSTSTGFVESITVSDSKGEIFKYNGNRINTYAYVGVVTPNSGSSIAVGALKRNLAFKIVTSDSKVYVVYSSNGISTANGETFSAPVVYTKWTDVPDYILDALGDVRIVDTRTELENEVKTQFETYDGNFTAYDKEIGEMQVDIGKVKTTVDDLSNTQIPTITQKYNTLDAECTKVSDAQVKIVELINAGVLESYHGELSFDS